MHAVEEASVALPVQLYDPALQGMQVWKSTRGQTILLAVQNDVLSMLLYQKNLFQGKAATAAATVFAYSCSSKHEPWATFWELHEAFPFQRPRNAIHPFSTLRKNAFSNHNQDIVWRRTWLLFWCPETFLVEGTQEPCLSQISHQDS